MICPQCKAKSRVVHNQGNRRRRECLDCGYRFRTIEEVYDPTVPRPRTKAKSDQRQYARQSLATNGPWLPAKPWADWLKSIEPQFRSKQEMSWRMGISPRRLYWWLNRQSGYVTLPIIEEALWQLDLNTTIRADWLDIWQQSDLTEIRPITKRKAKDKTNDIYA